MDNPIRHDSLCTTTSTTSLPQCPNSRPLGLSRYDNSDAGDCEKASNFVTSLPASVKDDPSIGGYKTVNIMAIIQRKQYHTVSVVGFTPASIIMRWRQLLCNGAVRSSDSLPLLHTICSPSQYQRRTINPDGCNAYLTSFFHDFSDRQRIWHVFGQLLWI